jgi:hypothetical protein
VAVLGESAAGTGVGAPADSVWPTGALVCSFSSILSTSCLDRGLPLSPAEISPAHFAISTLDFKSRQYLRSFDLSISAKANEPVKSSVTASVGANLFIQGSRNYAAANGGNPLGFCERTCIVPGLPGKIKEIAFLKIAYLPGVSN